MSTFICSYLITTHLLATHAFVLNMPAHKNRGYMASNNARRYIVAESTLMVGSPEATVSTLHDQLPSPQLVGGPATESTARRRKLNSRQRRSLAQNTSAPEPELGGGAPAGGSQAANEAVNNLMEMGFGQAEVAQAYESAGNDVDTAAEILLSQREAYAALPSEPPEAPPPAAPSQLRHDRKLVTTKKQRQRAKHCAERACSASSASDSQDTPARVPFLHTSMQTPQAPSARPQLFTLSPSSDDSSSADAQASTSSNTEMPTLPPFPSGQPTPVTTGPQAQDFREGLQCMATCLEVVAKHCKEGLLGDDAACRQALQAIHALVAPGAAAAQVPRSPLRGGMQVFVKTLTGKTITIMLHSQPDGTFSTEALKEAIEAKTGVPQSSQRLLFGRKQLEDGLSLRQAGVTSDSSLHLLLRLRVPGRSTHAGRQTQASAVGCHCQHRCYFGKRHAVRRRSECLSEP